MNAAAAFGVILSFAIPGWGATTYCVDPAGSDSNAGTSVASTWKTVLTVDLLGLDGTVITNGCQASPRRLRSGSNAGERP